MVPGAREFAPGRWPSHISISVTKFRGQSQRLTCNPPLKGTKRAAAMADNIAIHSILELALFIAIQLEGPSREC